ncbi:phosphatidate cytidylyltransferase [Jonesia quinghaiensis]|uniref:phosphatidate cytidylyltransferase n=1 Tax=Jonesia quinghaiensis TaxID=262806 RepID=UPI0004087529|nr:phosphatidate cytidylyltransferase [Jonesia quinghaiensis]
MSFQEGLSNTATAKSGRNIPVAIAVAVGLLGVVAASLYFRKEFFVLVVIVAVCFGMWELAKAFERRDINAPLLPMWVGAAGMLVSTYLAGPEALMVSFILTIAGIVVWRVIDGGGQHAVRDCTAAVFATAYLPLMAGFVVMMLAQDDGPILVAIFILLAVANDTGGFFAGVAFGRHPLAPSISPKKSWEGLAGSFLLALAVGIVGTAVVLDFNPMVGVALGVLTPITATIGDLSESLIKRDLQIKDMGSILPGHGGVLDRIDSMLLTAPFVYLMFTAAANLPTGPVV